MASFLDLAMLGNFRIVFTFLFVYVLVYAILQWGKPFGGLGDGAKGIHAIISLAISVLSITYQPFVRLVNFTVPWFFTVALIAFFIIFIIRLFAGEKLDLMNAITKDNRIYTWVVVFAIVIILFGLGQAFGSQALEEGEWETTSTGERVPAGTVEPAEIETGADEFIDETGIGNTGTDGSRVATDDFGTNVINTLFNPKVLGLFLIMLIGVFAIFFIAS